MKRVLIMVLAALMVTGLGTLTMGGPSARADTSQMATPAIVQLPCAAEGGLKALYPNPTVVPVTFVNQTDQTLDIYWLDYSGQRVLYNVLAPGQSYVQGTYRTHSWVITDASGNCMTIYRVLTGGGTVTIQ